MIEHVWSVLCSMSSVDRESNNFSLFNVLQTLTLFAASEKDELIVLPNEIVSLWTRSEEDQSCKGKTRVTFCYPSGSKGKANEVPINLMDGLNYQIRIRSNGIKLPEGPGRYFFLVEYTEDDVTWKTATKLPLLVKFNPDK